MNITDMKKIITIALSFIFLGIASCSDFLDVIPDDTPVLDHAFSNRSVMEKFLFSCYAYLPDVTDPFYYPAHFGNRSELWAIDSRLENTPAPQIASGYQNTNNPLLNYWAGKMGGKPMFEAIRHCNIFLENAHIPKDIDEFERKRWIAEVKFLKAYYHFFLMELYGPIPLVKENLPLSASPDEVRVFREPIDECVDYIVELIDEALPDLPLTIPNPMQEDGRITQPIALGIKAKALVWAASPLFNGNPDYAKWIDSRGKNLVSTTYDVKKWERAATALKDAIDGCHLAGHELYRFNPLLTQHAYAMNDTLIRTMNVRKAITERWNKGVIWSSMDAMSSGKGGTSAFYSSLGNFQRIVFPIMYATDHNTTVSYSYAATDMAELFYTDNGVPINEDKTWNYPERYQLRTATLADKHEWYIATGQTTINLHFNREPRFYANLGIDRGFFEIATGTTDNGATFTPYLRLRNGELGLGKPSYSVKKLVAFETSASRGENFNFSGYDYRFPLLRLADLYLLYSEALNEMKEQPDEEVYYWIDQVRSITDLKGVVEAWAEYSVYPDRPKDKRGMREIIRKERLIELSFEGQHFWDIRRWKIADQMWGKPRMAWNTKGTAPADYYQFVKIDEPKRIFSTKEYLWPLSISDLRINTNLVQSYGW